MKSKATGQKEPPRDAAQMAAATTAWWPLLLIVFAALVAYHNSFTAPFVFDDDEAIVNNPAIRDLTKPGALLWGEREGGTSGEARPVLNLTLAVNYAVGGLGVRGYHVVNWSIHVAAALALFGLVRRTLGRTLLAAASSERATLVATMVAVGWAVHPLQTEAVTYVIQRAESLVALFYLGTLLAFVRSVETDASHGGRWRVVSVLMAALGMMTKEVMVGAPLIVLLYDRTFVAGSFAAAWRARRGYYLALAATWGLLAGLVIKSGGRGDSAGFDAGISAWNYLLTQSAGITHYAWLTLWPHPLVLDYGNGVVTALADVWPQLLALAALAGATAWALVRRPAWGFLGAFFFVVLAPSSSVVPIATQTMAEHRWYLALAVPLLLGAVALVRVGGRKAAWVWAGLVVAWTATTIARNADYGSRLTLWSGVVTHRPENARGHNNLGVELSAAGRGDEAMAHFRRASELDPRRVDARNNLGNELQRRGQFGEAIAAYEEALRVSPDDGLTLGNLGLAWLQLGRWPEAERRYRELLLLDPGDPSAHANLGYILVNTGRAAEAVAAYEQSARLQPDDASAQYNLAVVYFQNRRWREARSAAEAVLRLDPTHAAARNLLGQLPGSEP